MRENKIDPVPPVLQPPSAVAAKPADDHEAAAEPEAKPRDRQVGRQRQKHASGSAGVGACADSPSAFAALHARQTTPIAEG